MQLAKERIVVSVGGSLIVPDAVDSDFLKNFRTLILDKVQEGFSFSIVAGWKPGCSSDYVAVLMAKNLGARRLVNLSNIDYVYDGDPRKNKNARKIEKTTWAQFRKLIPEKWDPGLSSPFDPIAAKEAEAIGLEVAIINGTKLNEFSNYLDGKAFTGTTIS